jgi:hypothetical protein
MVMTAPKHVAARSTLATTDAGTELRIASAKGGLVVVLVWLSVWTYVVVRLIKDLLLQGGDQNLWLVVVFFSALWLGGALVLFWCAIGSERMTFHGSQLLVARALGRCTFRQRTYPLAACSGLRVRDSSDWRENFNRFQALGVVGPGTVAFDCNGETISFGLALADRDARAVVAALEPLFGGHLTSAST